MNRSQQAQPTQQPIRLGLIGYLAIYLAFAAVVARTLTVESVRPLLPMYLGAELLFLILYSVVLIAAYLPGWVLHLYFVFQSTLILWLLSVYAEFAQRRIADVLPGRAAWPVAVVDHHRR
ncbi:MAG: hypothetical protein ACWGO1_14250 [Anaerolineales bacterium]